jgi:hypothetical protein
MNHARHVLAAMLALVCLLSVFVLLRSRGGGEAAGLGAGASAQLEPSKALPGPDAMGQNEKSPPLIPRDGVGERNQRAQSMPTVKNPSFLTDGARSFVLRHIRDKAGDNRIYAKSIVYDCALARDILGPQLVGPSAATEPGAASIMNAALDAFQRRCGQFTEQELKELSAIPYSGPSPVLNLFDGDAMPSKASSRDALIDDFVSLANPVIFDRLWLGVLARRDSDGPYIYFRGTKYSLRNADVDRAMGLVPCLMGLNCTETSFRVAMPCLTAQKCLPPPDLASSPLAAAIAADLVAGKSDSFKAPK